MATSANSVGLEVSGVQAYAAWLAENADQADAFSDVVGAEAALTAWRRHLMTSKAAPASTGAANRRLTHPNLQ